VVLQAVTVLQQEHSLLVDFVDVDHRPVRRFPAREGDEQPVVEQLSRLHVAAGIGKRQEDAVELAAVKRLTGGLAGLFA